jgi:hypothetical protein
MFYEIGTDHGLPYDPFKVSGFCYVLSVSQSTLSLWYHMERNILDFGAFRRSLIVLLFGYRF